MIFLKAGVTNEVAIGPFLDDTDGKTAETGLTLSAADIRLKIGSANWAAATNAATHEENGWYRVDLSAAECVAGFIVLSVQEAGALPVWHEFHVLATNVYEALVAGTTQLWTTATSIGANVVNANALAADAVTEIQSGLATGSAQTALQTDVDDIQARLPAALVGGRMASDMVALSGDTVAADILEQFVETFVRTSGTAQAGGASTITLVAGDGAPDDGYVGGTIVLIGGTGIYQMRQITDYVASTKVATVDAAWAVTPNATTQYIIFADSLPTSSGGGGLDAAGVRAAIGMASANMDTQLAAHQSDLDDLQTRVPAALVGGRMDSSVGAMAADVLTSSAIAADAIGSSELAASAVTEIQTGLATSAALATAQADLDDIQTRLPAALVGGRMDASVGAMAAGVVTAAAIATNAFDADALAADAVTEIAAGIAAAPTAAAVADAVWDEILSGHVIVGSAGAALAAAGGSGDPWSTALPGSYGAGTAGKIIGDNLNIAVAAADGDPTTTDSLMAYVKQLVNTLVGTAGIPTLPTSAIPANAVSLAEAIRQIYDEVSGLNGAAAGGLDAAGVRSALGMASANMDTQLALQQSDLDNIQTRLPAALVSGRMDASVGAMAANVLTAAATAADYVTEMQSGLATAAAVAAIMTTAMTESYAADGAAPTPAQALFAIQQVLTEHGISGTTWTVRKLDGVATAMTLTLNNASTPTNVTRAS